MIYKDYQQLNENTVKVPYIDIVCKYCGSKDVIKYSSYGGVLYEEQSIRYKEETHG